MVVGCLPEHMPLVLPASLALLSHCCLFPVSLFGAWDPRLSFARALRVSAGISLFRSLAHTVTKIVVDGSGLTKMCNLLIRCLMVPCLCSFLLVGVHGWPIWRTPTPQLLDTFLTTAYLAQDWPDVRKQRLALLWISADVYKRAAHMKSSEDYGDIPLPTLQELFQVGRVGKATHRVWWLTVIRAVPLFLMGAAQSAFGSQHIS